jgi:hypothetical protein
MGRAKLPHNGRQKLDDATGVVYTLVMRITTGKVVGGQIVVEGEPLNEGSTVTILVPDDGTFTLGAQDEAALLEAIAEADRGELTDAEDVLRRIR